MFAGIVVFTGVSADVRASVCVCVRAYCKMYFMSKQTKLVSIHFNIFCHFQTMLNFPTDILTRATMGSNRRSVTVTVVQNCRRNGDTTAMCRNV